MTIMQVHCKSLVTGHLLIPCEHDCRAWGIAGEGKSSFVERSVAKFRRTSGASSCLFLPQQASTSTSAIRHVEMCGKSIRGVNPGLNIFREILYPGDHADLGGVEKAEGCQ